jgi:hypothetical protein
MDAKIALIIVLVVAAIASVAVGVYALNSGNSMQAQLGTVTVYPSPSPSPSPSPAPASNDQIIIASFNGNIGIVSSNGLSVAFSNSTLIVGQNCTLQITVQNIGTGPSTIDSAAGITITGAPNLTFTYTAAPPSQVIIPSGGSYVFSWTVTAIAAGTASPVVNIQPLS